ncbi:uncharacterized protein IUM83_08059 [Phytophthora cinnamomi]|uniref:uncharacterized protein n=1 Tax=Phytophthora cinnamomi TaxID=4785 RepID=UPI00355A4291|nr:hypothetical protein IUM83_08059 [Phytophthora cinnamomi]
MRRFIKAVQRISFDGDHTLSVVFMSKRDAALWDGADFKLRGSVLKLNAVDDHAPRVCAPPILAQHYALRVLGTERLNALLLMQVFGDIAQAPILDVQHPGLAGLSVADNDYWVVICHLEPVPRHFKA